MTGAAIYSGSFDPVTLGHMDIIKRAAKIMDCLIVAVLNNPAKQSLFTLDERLLLLRKAVAGYSNVQVDCFSGMLAAYARQRNAALVVRGVRNAADFEYESSMAYYNCLLANGLDTFFLPAEPALIHVSASAVRELAKVIYANGFEDGALDAFVIPDVKKALKALYNKN